MAILHLGEHKGGYSARRAEALWNLSVAVTVISMELRPQRVILEGVHASSVDWNAAGTVLAASDMRGAACTWTPQTGGEARIPMPDGDSVTVVRCHPQSDEIACGTTRGRVWIVSPSARTVRQIPTRESDTVHGLGWSRDGSRLALATRYMNLCLWDYATGQVTTSKDRHDAEILAVAWSPTSEQVATASADLTVRLWSGNGDFTAEVAKRSAAPTSLAWTADGRGVLVGWNDGLLGAWSTVEGSEIQSRPVLSDRLACVRMSADGRYLACASNKGQLTLRDASTIDELASHSGFTYGSAQYDVAFHPLRAEIAVPDLDRKCVAILEIETAART